MFARHKIAPAAIPAIRDRFNTKWLAEPNSGCWLWDGSYFQSGYGQFSLTHRVNTKAHRTSWELHRGPIPAGKLIMHKCDVRECVNPEHLQVGTCADNLADMSAKGRARRGEASPKAKLTAADIPAIRADVRRHEDIAASYGVSDTLIWAVKHGKCWRHV